MAQLVYADYRDIRKQMQPGDVLAFGGKGPMSGMIKWLTRGPVSHVGIVLLTQVWNDGEAQPGRVVQMIDSTSLDGRKGVLVTRVSDRLEGYKGRAWWLPLSELSQKQLDVKAMQNFLLKHRHARYDFWQAFRSGIGELLKFQWVAQSYRRMYCSELVAAAFKAGGLSAFQNVNPSKETPMELVRRKIFANRYYQLAGPRTEIRGFNEGL